MKKSQYAYVCLSMFAVISLKILAFGIYFIIAHTQSTSSDDAPFNYYRQGRDWSDTCKNVGNPSSINHKTEISETNYTNYDSYF